MTDEIEARYQAAKRSLFSTPELEQYYTPHINNLAKYDLDQLYVAFIPAIKRVLSDTLFTLHIAPLETLPSINDDPGIWLKNIVDSFEDPSFIYSWLNEYFFDNEPVLPTHVSQIKNTDLHNLIYSMVSSVAEQPNIISELQQLQTPFKRR